MANLGTATVSAIPSSLSRRNSLIKAYFLEGYEYRLIACFLYFVDGISISVRQIKRVLRAMNLRRNMRRSANLMRTIRHLVVVHVNYTADMESLFVVQDELRTSGSLLGYRMLCKRLKVKHRMHISRYSTIT